MATAVYNRVPTGKKKMTYKECCRKWGKAAMEQQSSSRGRYTQDLSKDQLAANIFAYIPETEWHNYYVARIGYSPKLLMFHTAITYGEVYKHDVEATFCPDCDDLIERHRCEECGRKFVKSDDNIFANKNEVARALGGWDNYYAANWQAYQDAVYDLETEAPTAGMLEKRAKEAEKLLGKRATYTERREVAELWEDVEAAKQLEKSAEQAEIQQEEVTEITPLEQFAEQFPQLTRVVEVAKQPTEFPEPIENEQIEALFITPSEQVHEELPPPTEVVEELHAPQIEAPKETGFFFGEIPANIALPKMPILKIEPQAPEYNFHVVNDVALVAPIPKVQEIVEAPTVKQTKQDIQAGVKLMSDILLNIHNAESTMKEKAGIRLKRLSDKEYIWAPKPRSETQKRHTIIHKWCERTLKVQTDQEERVWKKLDESLKEKFGKRKELKVKWRYGAYRFVRKTKADMKKIRMKTRKTAEAQKLLQLPTQIVESIKMVEEVVQTKETTPSLTSGKIFSTPSMKRKKSFKNPRLTEEGVYSLTQAILKIAKKNCLQVELIGKRTLRGEFKKEKHATHLCLHVKHMQGIRAQVDLRIPPDLQDLVHQAARVGAWNKEYMVGEVRKGMSGFVLNPHTILGPRGHAPQGIFVVRGAFRGVLYDARMKLGRSVLPYIEQYSNTGEKFWDGYDKEFRAFLPVDRDHVCESNYKPESAGSLSAALHHMLLPMYRTTCKECSNKVLDLSRQEWNKHVKAFIIANKGKLERDLPEMRHLPWLMSMLQANLISENKNIKAFNTIQQLIGDRVDAPFTHVNEMNKIIVKGGLITEEEFVRLSEGLLEVARYLKNRTESIKKGSLASFRNKISQKSHVNLSLMCDNQLDKNGNLIWGERGYHSKRFFSNYFEVVDPTQGYDKFIVRKNPNGQRKLAIGKLIVSTNFSTFREQMKGEPIPKLKLDRHCTSLLDGNFVYPCCCVTLDDGTPLESEFKLPTKNHLVIGNAGDPKYVDMPKEIEKRMYIAKEGYCYVNIFLAMLVNVNEEDAKDFTKQVRDVLMEKLGKWPSLFDVATACAFMSVFYPETRNAELPRILVDHSTKTMHVIDSFGSLSTGYHVLKANTVSQLIQFASDSLDSEMKHYLVGGMIGVSSGEERCMNAVIKGIFKPKLMQEILENDPYILLVSVLSPKVLLALFNSGSLDRSLDKWLTKDQEVSTIIGILQELGRKTTVARTLDEQINVIEGHASFMIDNLWVNGKRTVAHALSQNIVRNLSARRESNRTLYEQGYRITAFITSYELMEKIWDQRLKEEWSALNWQEKLSSITLSLRYGRRSQSVLPQVRLEDLKDKAKESYSTLLTRSSTIKRGCANSISNKLTSFYTSSVRCVMGASLGTLRYLLPDVLKFVNILLVVNLLLQIAKTAHSMAQKNQQMKVDLTEFMLDQEIEKLNVIYNSMCSKEGKMPTKEEFLHHVNYINPTLVGTAKWLIYQADEDVFHQAKSVKEVNYERIIAFIALILMVVDAERSDCVYKSLNKLKGLMATIGDGVYHQSLDDITNEFEEKKQTIDFELQSDEHHVNAESDNTFGTWWRNQLDMNNVVPHYRTEGHFMEFTRANAVSVANAISVSPHNDILIRGAVGSGKSTGLPFYLSRKGRVLLLEPTRPLAENVHKQLAGEPFMIHTTLRMRGMSIFGSAPIAVMTSGFAFNYYANNPDQLTEYDYIIIDECHVNDAQAMAFRCLLHEHLYKGKVLKVSATPPGREVEFSTQYPVKIRVEERLSFQNFVEAQGTGSNADVTSVADNILVYVASYNEVDELSKLLTDKRHKVTKIDGRTMKVGNVEILTSGNAQQKHFVVATNIIENGVTLDIDAVVDFGTKVTACLDVDLRMIRTTKGPINYGERIQRLGRVGRHKPGIALRIGYTEKGLCEIPQTVATEAAFLSFAYGLPVMTNNVSTSLLSACTVRQARTVLQFELTPFYMVNLVRYDGSMHQALHSILKKYKLRDSEVVLNKLAIPNSGVSGWLTACDYTRSGQRSDLEDSVRIPFLVHTIPSQIHQQVWEAIQKYKHEAGFGRLSCISACKVAFTLQTDMYSIPRTIKILDALLESELRKKEHFRTITGRTTSSHHFTLNSIATMWRARYAQDYTGENIAILSAAKSQLLEFANLSDSVTFNEMGESQLNTYVRESGATSCVLHQSEEAMAKHLKLKGIWCKSLITQDLLVLAGVFIGGMWMILQRTQDSFNKMVTHQGKDKRQRQKLKFREARDRKLGFEVSADDGTIEHYFGEAYTKKGKQKGKVVGMGHKARKFINMYGFDPTEYSFVRFVDPLTGKVIDDSPYTDILQVQEQFAKVRREAINNDLLSNQKVASDPGITAYYINEITNAALKVDMTPHMPLKACDRVNTIAGFPEYEGVLRQTGTPVRMRAEEVPPNVESEIMNVSHESKSLFRGLRDYNPIASVICQLINTSDGRTNDAFGLGFGGLIITNRHLFKRNNGELMIKSRHGEFIIRNTTQLSMSPCVERDILIIKMPKDIPPFPQKLRFRLPKENERVCLVGSNFQDKCITSTISETSVTCRVDKSHFWKHWIDTKDGHCGLPIVSTTDGAILGLHSLSNMTNTQNFFAAFPENFEEVYLKSSDALEWVKKWSYNPDEVCWGPLELQQSQPTIPFKTTKLISDIEATAVYAQSGRETWVRDRLEGNLKAVGMCPAQLVTKHVVKGKCMLFELFLQTFSDEKEYFTPLLGAYGKSKLNKEAYNKDLFKYATPIYAGEVDTKVFERAEQIVIRSLRRYGFTECVYVTDTEEIIKALNMKAAVGALYSGKKKDYFQDLTDEDKDELLFESCKRLYKGRLGLWNGSLKAELRPMEKVNANKTRTFTAAPLDTLLGGKVCVDDFNNMFYNHHLKGPWTVGITKFYKGWDQLLRKLPDGWIYCDADGSQFDSSLSPYLINSVLNIRLAFMENWDIGEQMLRNLYTEIVYTPILTPDGTIVKKFKGNNSGQPSTVVDNTLMVILAMTYSMCVLGIKEEDQEKICVYYANGDDLLIAVEPTYEWILDSLEKIFKQLGLNYNFSERTKRREELWFMSHCGIERDGIFIPKLEPERVVSILEWDRSHEPVHRLEAICAAMVEAWGYDELLHHIRKFYAWVLDQAPYSELARTGKAPYIAETALKSLYTSIEPTLEDLSEYARVLGLMYDDSLNEESEWNVFHQSGEKSETKDAGATPTKSPKTGGGGTGTQTTTPLTKPPGAVDPTMPPPPTIEEIIEEETPERKKLRELKAKQPATEPMFHSGRDTTPPEKAVTTSSIRDRDVDAGTLGTFAVPRIRIKSSKKRMPKVDNRVVLNLDHLMIYDPEQTQLSNARATQEQFKMWYEGVKDDYGVTDDEMAIVLNGLMVWCIENGTSPNINGMWVMMDGEEQVTYPIKPLLDHATPTFRQIMTHFSDIAEAYIEKRNRVKAYMPRYGLQRNLTDMSLARYAFDFYELNSNTPVRAREAHMQMKAAALKNAQNRLFGLDGNVSTQEEDTERHTATDVTRNIHNLLGMRGVQ